MSWPRGAVRSRWPSFSYVPALHRNRPDQHANKQRPHIYVQRELYGLFSVSLCVGAQVRLVHMGFKLAGVSQTCTPPVVVPNPRIRCQCKIVWAPMEDSPSLAATEYHTSSSVEVVDILARIQRSAELKSIRSTHLSHSFFMDNKHTIHAIVEAKGETEVIKAGFPQIIASFSRRWTAGTHGTPLLRGRENTHTSDRTPSPANTYRHWIAHAQRR